MISVSNLALESKLHKIIIITIEVFRDKYILSFNPQWTIKNYDWGEKIYGYLC